MTLKEIRQTKGLTQVEAAKILNIPIRTYKRYESEISHSNSLKIDTLKTLLNKVSNKDKDRYVHYPEVAIIGAGFVGKNFGMLLSSRCKVSYVDIDEIKRNELKSDHLNVFKSVDELKRIEVGVICLPTNFNGIDDFETKEIEHVAKQIINKNKNALIVIKSTVNIGYCESLEKEIGHPVYFIPEFLREKHAKYDSFYPNKIIVGGDRYSKGIRNFAKVIEQCIHNDQKTMFMSLKEAEATKLYSNAYLAMRVSFFNEIDSLSIKDNLNTKKIINALNMDPRIGDRYNQPSFGFSGYCLPKDTEVLAHKTGSKLIQAAIESNKDRKDLIVKNILERANRIKPNATIGFYNLESIQINGKYRVSSTTEIIDKLSSFKGKIVVLNGNNANDEEFKNFVKSVDLIVANIVDDRLNKIDKPVFTRNMLHNDK